MTDPGPGPNPYQTKPENEWTDTLATVSIVLFVSSLIFPPFMVITAPLMVGALVLNMNVNKDREDWKNAERQASNWYRSQAPYIGPHESTGRSGWGE